MSVLGERQNPVRHLKMHDLYLLKLQVQKRGVWEIPLNWCWEEGRRHENQGNLSDLCVQEHSCYCEITNGVVEVYASALGSPLHVQLVECYCFLL